MQCLEEADHLKGSAYYDPQLDPLRDDVYQSICLVVGGSRNVRENVFSPYYHFVDFEVWLDKRDIIDNSSGKHSNTYNFLPIGKFTVIQITMK